MLEREDALTRLLELARRSASQRGQLALVSGEAGVGKSALVEALTDQLRPRHSVGWGGCDALFTPRQFGPFQDIAHLLGPAAASALRGQAQPGTVFTEVMQGLAALPQGTVLVLEDLHWADHATLDLLKVIGRRIAPLRLLLILTFRDDEIGPDHPLTLLLGDLPAAHTTRLALQPLSAEAVRRLAQAHGRDGDALHRATAGNPFFLSEVLAQPSDALARPPGSVRDAVLARLQRISPAERHLLEALSVAPDPMSPAVVARLIGPTGPALAQACETRGLLVREAGERGARLRFRHELARVATLEALSFAEQQAHHRRLLEVYLAIGDPVPPDLLVHHAAALGDGRLLLEAAPRAARQAAAAGAHHEAAAQLATALRHVDQADRETAATLYQDWAYEAGLSRVTDAVIAARHQAIDHWRALGRLDRVGHNLRWLWRLHWYRGEIDAADAAAAEAMAVLEALGPSAELAQACALRAHQHLLKARRQQAITWAQRAHAIALQFGDRDSQLQALITEGTACLFDGRDDGRALLDQALTMALADGAHEQAARVYTNYSEYAIVVRDWPLAERLVLEGLAFDIRHGLDAWTGYLSGRHAQLRLEQGRFDEALTLARAALAVTERTLLMRLPAMTVLATVLTRLGDDEAEPALQQLLAVALSMREQQRITPVRLALIEHRTLAGQLDAAREQLHALLALGPELLRPWDAGAVRVWARRLAVEVPDGLGARPTAAQALELAGRAAEAADLLDVQGAPFDAAMVRLLADGPGHAALLQAAHEGFMRLGSRSGLQAARRLAEQHGQALAAPKQRRGPYRAARSHPLGLTAKEVQVLALLAEGASNAEIARRLSRSARTVEHHVSAILGKLNAENRMEAILRTLAEPWIVGRPA